MARRKKTSPLEDVLDLLAMLPWWACVVLAAVSYLSLHPMAAPIQASDIQGQGGAIVGAMMQKAVIHGLATAGQYIVPILCLAAAALSAWRRKQRQTLVSDVAQARNADALDGMSWQEFELLVGEAYRLQGYRVTEIGGGGPDGGVDLVLAKGSEKFFVQCKQWKAFKVGVSTVRELYGVMAAHGAAGGFVVTSGRFTQEAAAFASGRNVQLIDGPALMPLLREARGKAEASPSVSNAAVPHGTATPARSAESAGVTQAMEPAVSADPSCPKCGKPMVQRVAKRGAATGKAFWGCSDFSAGCRGTRELQGT